MKKNTARGKNILFFLIYTVLLIFILTSCKNKKESLTSEQSIIVGFSQIGAESAWRTCNTQSIHEAAQEAGIQLLYANAEQKQENQIKAIRSFIVYQVDVIVFVPIVQDGWDNVLREAKEANIPVLVIDRKLRTVDESLYTAYIGSDHVEEGRNAARFLIQKFKDARGPFRIMEIRGTDGSSSAEGRYRGFREIIKTDKKFEIVASENGDFLRSRGREITESYLKNPVLPFDIVFSHNDGMTLGMLDVLETTDIKPGQDIVIVSVDAEQAAIDALKEGKINCIIECNPKLGDHVMELVKKLAKQEEVTKLTHVTENIFQETDDLHDLPLRGY